MVEILGNSQVKALTTLARMKIFLSISGDSKDSLLTMLINQVTGDIERYINRNLLSQTYTNEEYDGTGTSELVLKQYPVTTFTQLQENAASDNNDDWQTIGASNYFTDLGEGILSLIRNRNAFDRKPAGVFLERKQKYRVTYIAGYLIDFDNENTLASHTLPSELEYVTQKLVSAVFNTRKAEGLASQKVGDLSVTLKKAVFDDKETRAILDRYRRFAV